MITREQALTAERFHEDGCSVSYGVTGRAKPKVTLVEWRRNGRTQTWVTRPDEFSVPVKYGLHSYDRITDREAGRFHVSTDCPALAEAGRWWAADEAGAHTGRV